MPEDYPSAIKTLQIKFVANYRFPLSTVTLHSRIIIDTALWGTTPLKPVGKPIVALNCNYQSSETVPN